MEALFRVYGESSLVFILKRVFPTLHNAPAPFIRRRVWRTTSTLSSVEDWGASFLGVDSVAGTLMDEKDVGILCYANTCPGFKGILKQRFSDFIVNEVDLEGNVVHLTSLAAPVEQHTSETPAADTNANSAVTKEPCMADYEPHIDTFKALAGEENATILKELFENVIAGKGNEETTITLLPDSDKAHRTEVHTFFREHLPSFVTDTVVQPNPCVRVRYNNGSLSDKRSEKRGRSRQDRNAKRQKKNNDNCEAQQFDSRGKDFWPPGKRFCQFYLYKENKNTQSAIMIIAQKLGVKAKAFGFAGTKDKRAITTQRATIFKYPASKLAAVNKSLFGIKMGNFSYVEKGLMLGQLSGNRFCITLRDVVAESEFLIKEATEMLGRVGFINYYGLQRFGFSTIPTHLVGASLFRGEWKTVVDLILQPREEDERDAEEARKYFQATKNHLQTLSMMPHHMVSERAVLLGLHRHPGNYLQAIYNIPRTLRTLYIHSYQSYLWNSAASYRIQKYGIDSVIEGDIVYCDEDDDDVSGAAAAAEDDEASSEAAADIDVIEEEIDLELCTSVNKKVKHITKEEVASKKYSIQDVLLPLPGANTVFPANDVADVYFDLAKKDSVELTSTQHNVKDFSTVHLKGGYRQLLVKPLDFEWKMIKYKDSTQALVSTDMEKMNAKEKEEKCEEESDGHLLALLLQFTLPSSCYATMAVRELLKTSTSGAYHKKLTKAAEQSDE